MYRLHSFGVLLLALHCVLAMPDHPASMRMSGELSHEVDMRNETDMAANATTSGSAEDDDDDNADDGINGDDDDDDEIHVQGKSSSCPARQPEIVEIEKQCLTELREMKKKGPCMAAPTKEIFVIEKEAPNAATIRLETVPDSSSTEETTDSPGHKHHARMSFYYHCVLKKLDLLNEAEVPSKPKIEAWVVTNVTDATQREQTQERVNHCLSELKDEIEGTESSSTESTEETEQSTESSSKKQDQLKCDISKMLVCCLHHVECPVIKYP